MAPIHSTDLAEYRWLQAEWEHCELWEKQELRLKKRRRIWVLSAFGLFLILSMIPIVMDRWPKWQALSIARRLVQEIDVIKREAILQRSSYRLRLLRTGALEYLVEKVSNCQSHTGEVIRSGSLYQSSLKEQYTWLLPVDTHAPSSVDTSMDIPYLLNSFCYDPYLGHVAPMDGSEVTAMGVVSVNDLTDQRLDRVALILIRGRSGEMVFD